MESVRSPGPDPLARHEANPTAPEHEYVLGTDDEELVRLEFQHRVWSEQAFAAWERAGFAPGQTILDVGCGPGFAAFDLARLVGPEGRVVAVDASARFITHLEAQRRVRGAQNIEARVADVQRLDPPAASVDGAYARWLLCFVSDPEAVVRNVARALRPRGVFAVQDYFNYRAIRLAPGGPALERVVRAVEESWRSAGGDPDVGGKLPAMMARCGLTVREIRPILRLARPGSTLWHWPATFFRNFVPKLVEMGLLTPADQTAFETEWSAASADPSAFFCTPPVFEIIAVNG